MDWVQDVGLVGLELSKLDESHALVASWSWGHQSLRCFIQFSSPRKLAFNLRSRGSVGRHFLWLDWLRLSTLSCLFGSRRIDWLGTSFLLALLLIQLKILGILKDLKQPNLGFILSDISLNNILALIKSSSHYLDGLATNKSFNQVAFTGIFPLICPHNCKPTTCLLVGISDNLSIVVLVIFGYTQTRVVATGHKGHLATFVRVDVELLGYFIFVCV